MSRQFPIVRHEVYDRGTSSEKWTTIVTHEVSTSSVLKIEKVSREARRGFSTTDDPEQAFVWLNYELTPRRYVDSIAVAALRASIGRGQSLVRVIGRPGEDPRAVEASIMDIDGWKCYNEGRMDTINSGNHNRWGNADSLRRGAHMGQHGLEQMREQDLLHDKVKAAVSVFNAIEDGAEVPDETYSLAKVIMTDGLGDVLDKPHLTFAVNDPMLQFIAHVLRTPQELKDFIEKHPGAAQFDTEVMVEAWCREYTEKHLRDSGEPQRRLIERRAAVDLFRAGVKDIYISSYERPGVLYESLEELESDLRQYFLEKPDVNSEEDSYLWSVSGDDVLRDDIIQPLKEYDKFSGPFRETVYYGVDYGNRESSSFRNYSILTTIIREQDDTTRYLVSLNNITATGLFGAYVNKEINTEDVGYVNVTPSMYQRADLSANRVDSSVWQDIRRAFADVGIETEYQSPDTELKIVNPEDDFATLVRMQALLRRLNQRYNT